jgi:hypothetical protein
MKKASRNRKEMLKLDREAIRKELLDVIRRRVPLPAGVLEQIGPFLLLELCKADPPGEEKKKEPDYTKDGEWGRDVSVSNVVFFRLKGKWDNGLVLREPAKPCDDMVVEALILEAAKPCPPQGGFADLLSQAEKKAKDEAEKLKCPTMCPDKFVDVIYKQWKCADLGALALVQARRQCLLLA